jgi:hypothetical protein
MGCHFVQLGLTLCLFVLGILSLYWAVLFRVENNMSSLKIWIVDFDGQDEPFNKTNADPNDGPIVGPIVMRNAAQLMQSAGSLGFSIKRPSDFENDPMAVRMSIYNEEAYAAIIVNTNATALLRSAISQRNTSYDPKGAGQIVLISARDQSTYSSYVLPGVFEFQLAAGTAFGLEWSSLLGKNGSALVDGALSVPQAINPAIGFTLIDLRPFNPPMATPSISIGLIYLIIIAFFSFPFFMPVHSQLASGGNRSPFRFTHLIIWRIFSSILFYFLLSLCYSLVSLAFQIPFSNSPSSITQSGDANAYGKASFVVYWMLNWVGMAAVGFPSENMSMVLGLPWNALWLMFWVITNVATGFYPLDLAPGFFSWGYAWPLHNST